MNIIKKAIYLIGLLFIALFLTITHTKFLDSIDPGKDSDLFIILNYDFKIVNPYIFGACFGIVTTAIIALIDKKDRMFWYFAIAVAAFEMIGVFLFNNTELLEQVWRFSASVYYGLYAGFIIVMYAYVKHEAKEEITTKPEKPITFDFLDSPEYKQKKAEAAERDIEKYHDAAVRKMARDEDQKIMEMLDFAKFDKQQKKKIILQMQNEGDTPDQIAKTLRIHKATVYRHLKQK